MAGPHQFIPDFRIFLLIGVAVLSTGNCASSVSTYSCLGCDHTSLPDLEKQANCNFDGDICYWTQSTNDSFDWTRQRGPSATSGTGPDTDHTDANDSYTWCLGQGFYMFIESSAPRGLGETAKLVSHELDPWNNDKMCFSFWYNMNGITIGTLQVLEKRTKFLDTYDVIWSKTGAQGQNWIEASVSIKPPGPLNIIMEASVGDGYTGDIAIDDVKLTAGDCQVHNDISGASLVG